MTSLIDNYLRQANITADEWRLIFTKLNIKVLKSGEHWITEGKVCTHFGYLAKGILRTYYMDKSDNKCTLFFHFKGKPVTDLESFIYKKPSRYYIECLCDATIYTISYEDREYLLSLIPNFETAMRLMIEDIFMQTSERLVNQVILSAKERYLMLVNNDPENFNNLSMSLIADYINVKPQSLSRIRKNIMNK